MRLGFFLFFSHDYLSTRPSFIEIDSMLGERVRTLYTFFSDKEAERRGSSREQERVSRLRYDTLEPSKGAESDSAQWIHAVNKETPFHYSNDEFPGNLV